MNSLTNTYYFYSDNISIKYVYGAIFFVYNNDIIKFKKVFQNIKLDLCVKN